MLGVIKKLSTRHVFIDKVINECYAEPNRKYALQKMIAECSLKRAEEDKISQTA
jgi:hypothetical protein